MSKLDLINPAALGSSLEAFPKSTLTGRSELDGPQKLELDLYDGQLFPTLGNHVMADSKALLLNSGFVQRVLPEMDPPLDAEALAKAGAWKEESITRLMDVAMAKVHVTHTHYPFWAIKKLKAKKGPRVVRTILVF